MRNGTQNSNLHPRSTRVGLGSFAPDWSLNSPHTFLLGCGLYTHQPAKIGQDMRRITATIVTTVLLTIGIGTAHAAQAPKPTHSPSVRRIEVIPREPQPTIKFRHGDISWLPQLAAEAGWPPHTWKRLGHIILRESGACERRRGGDIVNKNCEVVGHDGSNHRSDTSLLQINGVNYDLSRNKWAAVCLAKIACTQEPLLDALTNLRAGLVLFKIAGWDPWTPPPGGW